MNKLDKIVDYLNNTQDFSKVIKFDEDTTISKWECGAIVNIKGTIYFLEEDDGYWWRNDEGVQYSFSIRWLNSFINALQNLNNEI